MLRTGFQIRNRKRNAACYDKPGRIKRTYEEMEPEEKAVVEEFEGKEEYEKTLHNKDFYLVNENAFLIGMDKAV